MVGVVLHRGWAASGVQDRWKRLKGKAERPVKEAPNLDQLWDHMNWDYWKENEEEKMNMRETQTTGYWRVRKWERMVSKATLEIQSWPVVHGWNQLIKPIPWLLLSLSLSTSLICSFFQQTFLSPVEGVSYSPQPVTNWTWCFCCLLGICPLELILVRVVEENPGKIRRTAWLLKRK